MPIRNLAATLAALAALALSTSTQAQIVVLQQPPAGSILDNGRDGDRQDAVVWCFSWSSSASADSFQLFVKNVSAIYPVIDVEVPGTFYQHFSPGSYIAPVYEQGWYWQVRARTGGVWGPWSEQRFFSVEPVNTDPPNDPTDDVCGFSLSSCPITRFYENPQATVYRVRCALDDPDVFSALYSAVLSQVGMQTITSALGEAVPGAGFSSWVSALSLVVEIWSAYADPVSAMPVLPGTAFQAGELIFSAPLQSSEITSAVLLNYLGRPGFSASRFTSDLRLSIYQWGQVFPHSVALLTVSEMRALPTSASYIVVPRQTWPLDSLLGHCQFCTPGSDVGMTATPSVRYGRGTLGLSQNFTVHLH